jgi:hypothetical protein
MHGARCAEGQTRTYENGPRFERISDVQSPVGVLREHARRKIVVYHLNYLWDTTSELKYRRRWNKGRTSIDPEFNDHGDRSKNIIVDDGHSRFGIHEELGEPENSPAA